MARRTLEFTSIRCALLIEEAEDLGCWIEAAKPGHYIFTGKGCSEGVLCLSLDELEKKVANYRE